jgi:DNA-binding transcriptional ArsR family regulator
MAAKPKLQRTRSSKVVSGPHTSARPNDDLPELDRLIHERIRLGIVSALAINDSLSFNDLRRLLKTTDGNLSVHARKLEEASYIACRKFFEGRIPHSEPESNRPKIFCADTLHNKVHCRRGTICRIPICTAT